MLFVRTLPATEPVLGITLRPRCEAKQLKVANMGTPEVDSVRRLGEMIPNPALARELGVTTRTISRWLNNPKILLPRPIEINRRKYFERGAIEAWKVAFLQQALRSDAA